MLSVCHISNYYMQYCVYYMQCGCTIGIFLAYVAALFVAIVSKLSKARGTDASTRESTSLGRRSESATAKVLSFKVLTFFSYIT